MYPPLFAIVSIDGDVQTSFGTSPVKGFSFGGAPEMTVLPYAVWQVVGGTPENYMGNSPDMDTYFVQVDVYGKTAASARNSAETLRDAIEPNAHVVSWRGESKDAETQHYRYSFDVNFLTAR